MAINVHGLNHERSKWAILTHLKYPVWVRLRYWHKYRVEYKLKSLREFHEKHNVPALVRELGSFGSADGLEMYIEDAASMANEYS